MNLIIHNLYIQINKKELFVMSEQIKLFDNQVSGKTAKFTTTDGKAIFK
jgi:hypothetical protein